MFPLLFPELPFEAPDPAQFELPSFGKLHPAPELAPDPPSELDSELAFDADVELAEVELVDATLGQLGALG